DPPTGVNIGTEDTLNYGRVASSDDVRWNPPNSVTNTYLYRRVQFHINESISDVVALSFSFEGYGSQYVAKIWIYNYTSGFWEQQGYENMYIADTDMHGSIVTGISNYINSTNNVSILITTLSDASGDDLFVDYVYLRVLSKATHFLDHKWRLTIPQFPSGTLSIEGKTSGETMKFYYSLSSAGTVDSWTYMFSLTSTTETIMQFNFGSMNAGELWIGVIDGDRTLSDTTADTLTLDAIWLNIAPGPPIEMYRYVDGYAIRFGSIINFDNAKDDDSDYATLAEQNTGLTSAPTNHDFNTSADGWSSAAAGTDAVAVTNGYDGNYGNPKGSIFTQLESKWANADTNGIGIWEAEFDYYLGVPTSATIELNR
ncbi:MAG: hypothetical protein ACPL1Y_07870, partial [Thermoplasmata archaeon]